LSYRRAREIAVDAVPSPMVVVHHTGAVAMVNAAARQQFGLSGRDVGRPFQDLEISYRPVELRSALEQVVKDQRPLLLEQIQWSDGTDGIDCFDIHVVPLADAGGVGVGVAVTFIDVSLPRRLREELEHSNRDLETAYEELQSTNEELETTNEELQSTIEELETTNEELQSTNEELETTNEELQSMNEELETMNQEVGSRAHDLDRVNLFLEGILGSLGVGIAVLDRDRRVQVWNDMANEMWGMRSDEVVGQDFLTLDIGLPVVDLQDALSSVLNGERKLIEHTLESLNRRGRTFECSVRLMGLRSDGGAAYGAIVLMAPA
jgi:two-component system CheB/CheR fusion protein